MSQCLGHAAHSSASDVPAPQLPPRTGAIEHRDHISVLSHGRLAGTPISVAGPSNWHRQRLPSVMTLLHQGRIANLFASASAQ